MKHMGSRWVAVCTLSAALAGGGTLSGCRSAATPPRAVVEIRNPDGSITNPDGSVTYPAGVRPPSSALAVPGATTTTTATGQTVTTIPAAGASSFRSGATQDQTRSDPRVASGSERAREDAGRDALNDANGNGYPAAPVERREPVITPVRLTVPAGTSVSVRLNNGLAASRNNVGDRWSGSLNAPLLAANGQTVFPAGTAVSGEVVAAKGRGRFKGAGDLGIALTAIGREGVSSSEYETIAKGRGKRTAAFIGGGAGLGALIGGLAGHGKGALIGGLAGAGAGTAAGAYTGNRDVVIPAESIVRFRLTRALTR